MEEERGLINRLDTETERDSEGQSGTERDKGRETETERDNEGHSGTERDKDRETETGPRETQREGTGWLNTGDRGKWKANSTERLNGNLRRFQGTGV